MKKIESITPVHHYGGKLIIGDAAEIINKIKQSLGGDDPFIVPNSIEFINEIQNLKKLDTFKFFCMPHSGGAWHQLFYTIGDKNIQDGFFIDTASANFRIEPWLPKKFYTQSHSKELFENVKNSINNSKPVAEFDCPSKKILLCEARGEIAFYGEEGKISIDYKNKSTNDIIKELDQYCFEPKIKFSNFSSKTKDFTFDFYIGDVTSEKYEVYKIELQNKKLKDFANYYAKYYLDEKDLYKKNYLDKKQKNILNKWREEQLESLNLSLLIEKDSFNKGTADIEKYEYYTNDYGFVMGYYFKKKIK